MHNGKELNITKCCKDINGEMRRITLDLYPDNLGSSTKLQEEDVECIGHNAKTSFNRRRNRRGCRRKETITSCEIVTGQIPSRSQEKL